MNRRHLLQTIVGTVAASVVPVPVTPIAKASVVSLAPVGHVLLRNGVILDLSNSHLTVYLRDVSAWTSGIEVCQLIRGGRMDAMLRWSGPIAESDAA